MKPESGHFLTLVKCGKALSKSSILTVLTRGRFLLTFLTGDPIDQKTEPEFPYIALSLHGHVDDQVHLSGYP